MEKGVEDVNQQNSPRQLRSISHMISGLVGWVALTAASFIGSQYLVSVIVFALAYFGVVGQYDSVVGSFIFRLAVYVVMVTIIGAVVWYRYRKLTLNEAGIPHLPEWSDIGLSIAGAIVYVLASTIALTFAAKIPGFNTDQPQDLGFTHLFGSDLIVAFVVLVVLTPLFEEAIFRGFLYGRLRGLRFPWWLSAITVSLLFGLAHMQWNVGVDVFFLSMVACTLREMTGSIWAGVLIHTAKNFLAFLVITGFIQGISGS